ncbi:MAG: flagellar motor protein MotB [Armatimonadetes bacterium]|nr:flagellar motor protein MotB [Armatimonadota bacterium]
MRKKREEHSHGALERWLLTYADMITLLMAFFIMMYSMSVLNLAKFRQAAISIRSGFGGTVDGQGRSILKPSGEFGEKSSALEGDTAGVRWRILKPFVDYIEKSGLQKAAAVGENRRGIVITMATDSLLFDPGSSRLKADALPLLDKVAEALTHTRNLVRVEGHTCDLPPRGGIYQTNWELSTARATEVLRYLVEHKGLSADRFAAAGYASTRPKAANDSEENRALNRRVEIVILRPEAALIEGARVRPMRRISDPGISVFQRRL